MSKFRVGFESGFTRADGTPTYPVVDLDPLRADPAIEFVHLKSTGVVNAAEVADLDALLLLGARFDAESAHPSQRLSLIARFGVGYDTVDVEACTKNAIALAITPDGVRRPVAVSVMAFLLALTGKMFDKDRISRMGPAGFAKKSEYMGVGLVGRTLGLVGIGNIGAETIRIAKPFDMNIVAHDPYADPALARELGVRLVDLDEVFRISDFISLHVPLSEKTHHLVNAQRIAMMKPTAFLINTARGPIVDQKALTKALQDKRIAGAGLDVFDPEPPMADDPILKLDNVILAPHALCHTDQCYAGIGASCVDATLAVRSGRAPKTVVNRDVLNDERLKAKLAKFAKL